MEPSISALAETFVKSTSVKLDDDTFHPLGDLQLPMSGNKRHRLTTHNNDKHVHHVCHAASQLEIVFIYKPRLNNVDKKRLKKKLDLFLPGFKKVKLSKNNSRKDMLGPFYALLHLFLTQHFRALLKADEDLTLSEKRERNKVMESFSAQLLVLVKVKENEGHQATGGTPGHKKASRGGASSCGVASLSEEANGHYRGDDVSSGDEAAVDPDTFLDLENWQAEN